MKMTNAIYDVIQPKVTPALVKETRVCSVVNVNVSRRYLQGVVVHLLGFLVRLVRHQPGLQQVLIETVAQATHRHMICNTHAYKHQNTHTHTQLPHV